MSYSPFLAVVYFLLAVPYLHRATGIAETATFNEVNNRPIIGILSQEVSPDLLPPSAKGISYIAASYIKYIESAGGRVVPILTTMDEQELETLFQSINGVLFPGGDAELFASKYFKNAEFFFNKAVKAKSEGDVFPIWGTCLGFQALASITAGVSIVSASDAIDISMPLNLTKDAFNSRMMKDAPKDLFMKLEKEALTYNYHYNCVSPDTFENNNRLKESFNVLSYNKDINGKTFISTIEGKKYPFYGTQWHPEKNSFEWIENRKIAHSYDAVIAAEYFANFFVNETRKSNHHFPSVEMEDKYLIYNFDPIYTGDMGHFEQAYIF